MRVYFICKHCSHKLTHDYTQFCVYPPQLWNNKPVEWLRTIRVDDPSRALYAGYGQDGDDYAKCPNCGKCNWKIIKLAKAEYSAKVKCDARCVSATSGGCSCSCGGANHGSKHLVAV